jgi:guanine deaminase
VQPAPPQPPPASDAVRAALMRRAVELARRSVREGGGPFGALVARGGEVLAEGTNRVTATCDPTAHAEIEAVRAACGAAGDHRLAGCELYSSCEPCPMCLGAAHWARVDRVWFAATRADAAAAGFDDERIYQDLARPLHERALPLTQLLRDEALAAFADWAAHPGRVPY